MQKKVLISLVLLVLLPLGLLAGLGLRVAQNEQKMLAVQVQSLVEAQLSSVDDSINAYFQTLQGDLLQTLSRLELSNESLKQFSLESAQVKQVLVIGADGKLLLPAPGAVLSQAERQFLQRVSAIVDNPGLLTGAAGLAAPASGTRPLFSSLSKRVENPKPSTGVVAGADQSLGGEALAPSFGWYAWHWNAELHHIFWWRDPQRRLIGFELAPVAVLSEIIARLPATNPEPKTAPSATRLINGSGQLVYEWGSYRPPVGEKSLAMRPLGAPLASWKLEYFAPTLAGVAAANSVGILAGLGLVGLALVGLASYLYREHTREMRLAQQRVNFVNQVSHELKTPLTNIRLYAELLESELQDVLEDDAAQQAAKARGYIGIITAESQRLSRLIANVLRFGQFQKSQQGLRLQPGKVDELIERCVAAFKPALDAKGIVVHLDAHAGAPVLLDPQAVEQILNNLISNVEKYAVSGGAIHISSTQEAGFTRVDVRDFGPGIAASERARVFEPFYRVSSRLTDGVAGTGIGLDIARRLARLHGGDVSLQEVASGACFRVVLYTPPVEEVT